MATVDGLTKDRMLAIEAESITAARIDGVTNHLILTTHGGTDIDVGNVLGPQGAVGPTGPQPALSGTVAGPAAFGDAAVVGVSVTASKGDHKHGLPSLPTAPSCRVYRNAAYTDANTAWTKCPFDTVSWDTAGGFSTGTSLYTCPKAGIYVVSMGWGKSAPTSGQYLQGGFNKNGAAYSNGSKCLFSASPLQASHTDVMQCSAGDTINANYIDGGGGAAALGSASCFMSIVCIPNS